jgi:hypothetical protein
VTQNKMQWRNEMNIANKSSSSITIRNFMISEGSLENFPVCQVIV